MCKPFLCFLNCTFSFLLAITVCATTAAKEPVRPEQDAKPTDKATPTVQLALLLDTSNSMDGLIDQAKTQLWTIVNEFGKTELAGKLPKLEVALYEYGNDSLPATEGYIRLVSPFTDDLDSISEKLFALKTNGGEEYCGKVVQTSLAQLTWGKDRGLRCIFIAGNEPFSQGDVDYRVACKAAADKGITISTIFCGDRAVGIRTGWEDGATIAEGTYLCINQDHKSRAIEAPQDADLIRLSGELNKTYVPYGDAKARAVFSNRQKAQDSNAAKATVAAAASRANFKASGLYRNSGWDLVDALADGDLKLETMKEEHLPENMKAMSLAERRAYLEKVAKEREEIKTRIQSLTAEREAFVAQERSRLAAEAPEEADAAAEPFADAVKEAIEAQQAP